MIKVSFIEYSLFWDVTQSILVISYRRFGTSYGVPSLGAKLDSWRWYRYFLPKCR